MSSFTLSTQRLTLEWFSPEIAGAILEHRRLGDWAHDFPGDGETRAARYGAIRESNPLEHAPFLAYVIRENSSGLLIGGTSFHGRPRDRAVEIGYGLAQSRRGFGYATETCLTLIEAAWASGQVDRVEAQTERDNSASKAVLKRAGFSPLNDFETLWRIERDLTNEFVA
jgi:RimJ/RimL family protein N-acetyltransferase